MMTRLAALVLIAVVLVGCGATPPSSAVPTAAQSATPAVTAAPSPAPSATVRPTPLSQAAFQAAHIETAVTKLMSLSGHDEIKAWIEEESAWLDTVPLLPVTRGYYIAMTGALADLAFETADTNLQLTALEIIAAAREVPGVTLP
jgi:hypothetical protein